MATGNLRGRRQAALLQRQRDWSVIFVHRIANCRWLSTNVRARALRIASYYNEPRQFTAFQSDTIRARSPASPCLSASLLSATSTAASTALRKLIEVIDPQPDDTLITLGDCVDRGPDSREVDR